MMAGGDLVKLKELVKSIKKSAYGPITSWSLAYGLFRRGRVGMSLSYLTSLAYHQLEEKDSLTTFRGTPLAGGVCRCTGYLQAVFPVFAFYEVFNDPHRSENH